MKRTQPENGEKERTQTTGKGIMPGAPSRQTAGVVLWDERPAGPPVVSQNMQGGYGGQQHSSATVSSRYTRTQEGQKRGSDSITHHREKGGPPCLHENS